MNYHTAKSIKYTANGMPMQDFRFIFVGSFKRSQTSIDIYRRLMGNRAKKSWTDLRSNRGQGRLTTIFILPMKTKVMS